jgi:hypothetical protein
MLYPRAKWIIGVLVLLLSYVASAAALTSTTPFLDQGPLGAQLRSVAPTRLVSIESQLRNIIEIGPTQRSTANDNGPTAAPSRQSPMRPYIEGNGAQPTYKGGAATPTLAEKRQLAANPAFEKAYANDPVATLRLLRQVDNILRDAQN